MFAPALKRPVHNERGSLMGTPPDTFLDTLVTWARGEDDAVFAPNATPLDIFTLIKPKLAPNGWRDLPHRKAAMCEAIRVHAGFESGWNWNEGVDVTNAASRAHIEGQETGILQVSWDSTRLGESVREFAHANGILDDIPAFLARMKSDHTLALAYYARLVRVNIRWAGPLVHGFILRELQLDAVAEFERLLA
jgi:hypothetical protein